jgi:hypothetical protein
MCSTAYYTSTAFQKFAITVTKFCHSLIGLYVTPLEIMHQAIDVSLTTNQAVFQTEGKFHTPPIFST